MKTCSLMLVSAVISCSAVSAEPLYEAEFIFDPQVEDHGHVHASCIVECPTGDLRAVWYENGTPLPPPYFSEQRDKSDDVRIGGSRKPKGSNAWEKPFVVSDTFGVSDNNPCMVIDREQRLWLVHPTLTGVPKWTWSSALVRYKISSDYMKPGPPTWIKQDILLPHPVGFEEVLKDSVETKARQENWTEEQRQQRLDQALKRLEEPLVQRLGWMPRAHPLIRSDGAVVLPLSNENFDIPAMAITEDGGDTWTISNPVHDTGITQPTLAEFPDGQIVAFFRYGGPEHRIKRSESHDGGMTWSDVTLTDRPHPGAGIEAILLQSGKLALVYNDVEEAPRCKLAISLSEDRGKTWGATRHIENTPGQRFDYPSIVQAKDGSLHVTYSYNTKAIKHVRFNEEWIAQGD